MTPGSATEIEPVEVAASAAGSGAAPAAAGAGKVKVEDGELPRQQIHPIARCECVHALLLKLHLVHAWSFY